MTTETPRVNLRLSPESLADIKRFRAEMAATKKTTEKLSEDLKELRGLTQALTAKNIFDPKGSSTGGVNNYLDGVNFKLRQQVEQTKRLGTESQQHSVHLREQLTLAKQGLQVAQNTLAASRAQDKAILSQYRGVKKITNQQEVLRRIEALRLRAGEDFKQNDTQAVTRANRLIQAYQKQLQLLKEQERQRARLRNRPSDEQIVDRQRSLTQQRLFGDGGAGLFGVQSGIMANYMLLNAARGGITNAATFTVELDEALHNLQAITATTDGAMEGLSDRLVKVAEKTKFTAVEVANAAVTLGQSGMSTQEIEDSIEAVTLLATATGTDLARAVDVATSVLGVFSMESAQMSHVANLMTEAVNSSKLNIEKLTLGIQYSGNIAAQSGIRFDELTAALGAMANAGIRSGSTLGTGMRQIIISMQKPSGEFLATLDRLGLTMHDVDLRTQGLYGALSRLKGAGFTASDAIKSFQIRGASAYNALAGNLDQMLELEGSFQNTSAAARANEVQMRSLANQGRLFGAAFGALSATALEPLKVLLRDILMVGADWLSWLRENETAVQGFTTAVVSLGVGLAAWKFSRLVAGLTRLAFGTKSVTNSLVGFTTATKQAGIVSAIFATRLDRTTGVAARAVRRFGLLRMAVGALGGPLGLAAAALSMGTAAFISFRQEAAHTGTTLDQVMTSFADAKGEMERTATQIENVDNRLEEVLNRYDILNDRDSPLLASEIESVKNQFWELGFALSDAETDVDGLIRELRRLREELQEDYVARIKLSREESEVSFEAHRLARLEKVKALRGRLPQAEDAPDYPYKDAHGIIPFKKQGKDLYGNFAEDLENLLAPLSDSEGLTDVDAIRRAIVEISENINTNDKKQKGDWDQKLWDALRPQLQAILQELTESVLPAALEEVKAGRESKKLLTQEGVEEEKLNPAVSALFEGVESLRGMLNNQFREVMNPVKDQGAREKYATGVQFRDDIDAQIDAFLQSLDALSSEGLVGTKNANLLRQKLQETAAALQANIAPLAEAAGKVEEELLQGQTREVSGRLREFRSKLRDITTEDGANDLKAEWLATIDEYAEARRAQLEQQKADPEILAEAEAYLDNEVADLRQEAQTETGKVVSDLAQTFAEEDAERRLSIAKVDLERAENHLDALNKQLQWAATVDAAAEVYQQIVKAIGDLATKQGTVDTLEKGDSPDLLDALNQQRQEETQQALAEAENRFGTTRGRIRRGSGGSRKGSAGKKEDPILGWVKTASTQLKALTATLEAGTGDAEQNIHGLERVFSEAEDKLKTVEGELAILQSRLVNGTLTSKEQEHLNTLVERHGQLTNFIRENEERILETKLRHGNVQEALTGTVTNWMDANLDMGQTLVGGITGALGTAKTALTSFFTEWTSGAKRGGDAFRDMAVGILKSIQNIFAEMLTVYVLQKALGWMGFGGGTPIGDLFTAATGVGFKEGGPVKKYARGGRVQGNLQRDSVSAELMPEEYVLRASAAKAIGHDNLDKINAMGNRATASSVHRGIAREDPKRASEPGTMNLYLLDERSQVPALGPMDILTVVTDDMARGGATKKLIKSIQMGAV